MKKFIVMNLKYIEIKIDFNSFYKYKWYIYIERIRNYRINFKIINHFFLENGKMDLLEFIIVVTR